ncbi:hypothetical protein [Haloarcula marina]|uniref:hypothetical protein n=1 Tax=Haloarcula marina TaxID=2961574 RepID=UPI0020B80884|nr:hypothetical protein [Halomicroarcula marina]
MSKPDDMTWQKYIYDASEDEEEIKSKQPAFVEYLVLETEEALTESNELDEGRFDVAESNRWVTLEADGWQMDDQDEAVRIRDALREQDIGDESVRVRVMPWCAEDDGPGALPPGDAYEYSVQVELMRERQLFQGAVEQSKF